jgi:hypothetical protein
MRFRMRAKSIKYSKIEAIKWEMIVFRMKNFSIAGIQLTLNKFCPHSKKILSNRLIPQNIREQAQ